MLFRLFSCDLSFCLSHVNLTPVISHILHDRTEIESENFAENSHLGDLGHDDVTQSLSFCRFFWQEHLKGFGIFLWNFLENSSESVICTREPREFFGGKTIVWCSENNEQNAVRIIRQMSCVKMYKNGGEKLKENYEKTYHFFHLSLVIVFIKILDDLIVRVIGLQVGFTRL